MLLSNFINFADFHFARPLWFLGVFILPILLIINYFFEKKLSLTGSKIEQFVDKHLIPHLFVNNKNNNKKNKIKIIFVFLWLLGIIAMASPQWGFEEIDAYVPDASLVIVLDLSSSMTAEDVKPSRLVRARQTIEDILNLSSGIRIGLLGFAEFPHLIVPITDDISTIKNMLSAIDTSLIQKQGDKLASALDLAKDLLLREPGKEKSILLLSDGDFDLVDYSDDKIILHTLGVGTATGAPYKNKDGNWYKKNNNILISKINNNNLQILAKQGRGLYLNLESSLDSNLVSLINKIKIYNNIKDKNKAGKIRQWQDRYEFLLLPIMIVILILTYKRVLITVVCLINILYFMPAESQAFTIDNLFKNSEQLGQEALENGDFKTAAELFTDPYRKGVALYKSADYAAAEMAFTESKREIVASSALYNLANAQMQQQKWQQAVTNYETVLNKNPEHENAKNNLELAKKMLQEQKDQDKQDKQDKNKENQEQENDSKEQEQENTSQDVNSKEQEQEQKQDSENKEKISEKWLNTVDSDIKNFLIKKFYIEEWFSSQKAGQP